MAKMVSGNKLNRFWKNGVLAKMIAKTKILNTKEEISANTSTENVAGATVVKELINDLNQLPEFIYDESGKITGYKGKGGADPVFPFSKTLNFRVTRGGNMNDGSMVPATVSIDITEYNTVSWKIVTASVVLTPTTFTITGPNGSTLYTINNPTVGLKGDIDISSMTGFLNINCITYDVELTADITVS